MAEDGNIGDEEKWVELRNIWAGGLAGLDWDWWTPGFVSYITGWLSNSGGRAGLWGKPVSSVWTC